MTANLHVIRWTDMVGVMDHPHGEPQNTLLDLGQIFLSGHRSLHLSAQTA